MKVNINNPIQSVTAIGANVTLSLEHSNEPVFTTEEFVQRAQRALQAEFAAVPQVINQEQLDRFLAVRPVIASFNTLTEVLRQSNWKLPTQEPLWIPYIVTPPKGASIDVRMHGATHYGCKVYGAMAPNEGWRFSTAASFRKLREQEPERPKYTISIKIPKSESVTFRDADVNWFGLATSTTLTLMPTPKALQLPLDAFRAAGWTDQQLVDYGYAKWVPV